MPLSRRVLIAQLPAAAALGPQALSMRSVFYGIDHRLGARLGVHAMTADGATIASHHANEWFAMCSTFKLPLAGAVLAKVDAKTEQLNRQVKFTKADLLPTSPVTSAEVQTGQISIERLVSAVLEESDNTAANLLLRSVGGPPGLTQWLRRTGDPSTRLDRFEPDLNAAAPGDPRDSTSPKTMAQLAARLLFGNVLSPASKDRITRSMVASKTGPTMLRAGLPKEWKVGDKTGRGGNGATNNIAVIWPTNGSPVVVSVFLAECEAPLRAREAAIAEIGHRLTPVLG